MDVSQSALVSPKGWATSSPQRQNCHCQEKAPAAPVMPGPRPASSCPEDDQPGAKAQWLHLMPSCTGQGQTRRGWGCSRLGQGQHRTGGVWPPLNWVRAEGWPSWEGTLLAGLATDEKRYLAGSRRKADGGKSMGKQWIFKTQPANQSHCCRCLKRDQQK